VKLQINHTHRLGTQFSDISKEAIEACPLLDGGAHPNELANDSRIPLEIRCVISALPFSWKRKHAWLYVRPQRCVVGAKDTRTGSFYHLDVDAVHHAVAPAWDEFINLTVSFGNIAETEFIADPMVIDVAERPSSHDYVTVAGILGDPRPGYRTESPNNGQVMHYTTLDGHRAGPIRRTGTRLIMLGFETDSEKWP
jgi:hypothetical protein